MLTSLRVTSYHKARTMTSQNVTDALYDNISPRREKTKARHLCFRYTNGTMPLLPKSDFFLTKMLKSIPKGRTSPYSLEYGVTPSRTPEVFSSPSVQEIVVKCR